MQTRLKTNLSWKPRWRVFALVVVLSMTILLSILALGLLSLANISLRSSVAAEEMSIARTNARLALRIALGDLQKYAGPDTRVTGRAETLSKDGQGHSAVAANTPQAWWVGVAESDRTKSLDGGARQVVWLVSGVNGDQLQVSDPVHMLGDGSFDLALSGGKPIEAGRVAIQGTGHNGAYAYFVDDDGLKAQVAATRREVVNSSTSGPGGGPYGGGVLPGTYDLSVLDRMGALGGTGAAQLQKLVSTRDLRHLNVPEDINKSKFFSFTTSSQGVLADARKGGLKKDLTIAFENPTVFSNVFPSSKPDQYIVVDPTKRTPEISDPNGYIHWGIFRDYYNLKKHFIPGLAKPTLAPTFFAKTFNMINLGGAFSTPFIAGRLGPHKMWENTPSDLVGMPYGNFKVYTGTGDPSAYVFNPISPVLTSLQESAWLSPGATAGTIRTNVQLFTSHYNPYNVDLLVKGNGSHVGMRVHNYPQALFTGGGLTRVPALNTTKYQTSVKDAVTLEAGRSHVMGFGNNVQSGNEIDNSLYSEQIGSIVAQSIYKDQTGTNSGSMTVEFALPFPALMHGMNDAADNFELSQVFFLPFAWNICNTFAGVTGPRPGKVLTRGAGSGGFSYNSKVASGFNLRTTRESSNSVRPLVDANIRALWSNPRWDSPLGLPLPAAYTPANYGEIPSGSAIPEMRPASGKRGYSYMGNSRTASGTDRVILFDIPRRDLVSLGQLQHANAGRFSYEPTYIVGNSYANPRIPLGSWQASISDSFTTARGLSTNWAINGNFNLYDASYLVNEVMFDSFAFTTLPQEADDYQGGGLASSPATYSALLKGTQQLPNPRYLPYQPAGSTFDAAALAATGTATTGSFFHNAGHVMVDGAFNINSTSVDAWEAFLSGTHGLPVQKLDGNLQVSDFHRPAGVRFPRAASHLTPGMHTSSIDDGYWTGFRELEQTEVRRLAEEIVRQVKSRGPFRTLGEFVNRKLENSDNGKSGALQAALDNTVNKSLDTTYESPASGPATPPNSTQGAGFPGQLIQGDVLQALAPYMTVHSDTFTIRGYGEARDKANKVTARAWCEVVVQRVPDPVGGAGPFLQEMARPTSVFGRHFEAVRCRWLLPQEV